LGKEKFNCCQEIAGFSWTLFL